MKTIFFMAAFLSASLVHSQDPTLPSQAILDRIQAEPALVSGAASKPTPIPTIKLRGIVLRDANHGLAIVEADGQRLQLRLDRTGLKQHSQGNENSNATDSKLNKARFYVQIQGVQYHLEDFSAGNIIFSDGINRILVQ